MLTQETLKQHLSYDPNTGKFSRVNFARVAADGSVGTIQKKGYRSIYLCGGFYKAHRLAWLYVYGEWPKDQIDHINGNRDDNRIDNLREVCNAENAKNRRSPQGNNPFLGVTKKKWRDQFRWCARIMIDGKSKHIGYFKSAEDARDAYIAHKYILHGVVA